MMTQLRARGVMVDMEEGVVNAIKKSVLSELFDADQHVTSVSGCGNNWYALPQFDDKMFLSRVW